MERERGVRGSGGGSPRLLQNVRGSRRDAEARDMEVGHYCPAWWPCVHYVEHVAGDERGMVASTLGLDLG
jgi:hypothetical protein